ncbi:hypothetical protein KR093_010319 [Drosophila rubida]|uniref:Cullin N-terminal domain-containing protein n=1 Tax=Drosophila rubida TaxID=30044 RepID=A0AAD4K8V7_9MUSC|nr:hypothetical protein KR093_010319 [Drosophila rubida]
MDERYVKYVWIILKNAIQSLQRDNPGLSHEELYHKAYEVVMNKHGFKMYNGLRELLTEHLQTKVLPELLENLDGQLLSKLNEVWIEHQTSMRMLGDMLGYMDGTYAAQRGLESVYVMGLQIFRYEIVGFKAIELALREKLLDMIKLQRLGETIEHLEIKNACKMLVILGKGSRYVYEETFEKSFLTQTTEYYEQESKMILENKTVDYEQEMKLQIAKESARISEYLDKETQQRVKQLLEEIVEKYRTKNV